MARSLPIGIAAAVALIAAFCLMRSVQRTNKGSSMSREELIDQAATFARQQGWKVENYAVASVEFEQEKCWIAFQGKSGLPGDHFSVWLEAESGKVIRLVPGR